MPQDKCLHVSDVPRPSIFCDVCSVSCVSKRSLTVGQFPPKGVAFVCHGYRFGSVDINLILINFFVFLILYFAP